MKTMRLAQPVNPSKELEILIGTTAESLVYKSSNYDNTNNLLLNVSRHHQGMGYRDRMDASFTRM